MFVPSTRRAPQNTSTSILPHLDTSIDYVGHNVDDEIIDINVAGKLFQTYAKTLARYPKSLLGDPGRRNKFHNPETNQLFFDRHRKAFEAVLYYYQSGGIMSKPPSIPIHIFINELIFFDIGDVLIEKLQIENGLKEPEEIVEQPTFEPFRIMWAFLDDPESSRVAKLFAIASIFVIVVSLVMFVIETLPEFSPQIVKSMNGTETKIPSKHHRWMFSVNTGVICWFTIEFVLKLITCPNKFKFLISIGAWVDFLSILPYYIGFLFRGDQNTIAMLRVIRVLRVFKLAKHSTGLKILGNTLKASFNELIMLGFFLFVMILIFGSTVYFAESGTKGTKFKSIPNSFWWAIVTMTTVGYGDMYPKTVWGQIIGAMAVVCGVLTIALPVPVVVSNFEYFYTKERNRRKTEEARREDEKNKAEFLVRDKVNSRFDLLRNYAKNFRKLNKRASTSIETDETVLDELRPNGSCHMSEPESTQLKVRTRYSRQEHVSTV